MLAIMRRSLEHYVTTVSKDLVLKFRCCVTIIVNPAQHYLAELPLRPKWFQRFVATLPFVSFRDLTGVTWVSSEAASRSIIM